MVSAIRLMLYLKLQTHLRHGPRAPAANNLEKKSLNVHYVQ